MDRNKKILDRGWTVIALIVLGIYWLVFFFTQLPLVVTPGGGGDWEDGQNQIALGGLTLFFIAFSGICVMAGVFGKQKEVYWVGGVLGIGWIWASLNIYPNYDFLKFFWRLVADLALLFFLAWGSYLTTSKEPDPTR